MVDTLQEPATSHSLETHQADAQQALLERFLHPDVNEKVSEELAKLREEINKELDSLGRHPTMGS